MPVKILCQACAFGFSFLKQSQKTARWLTAVALCMSVTLFSLAALAADIDQKPSKASDLNQGVLNREVGSGDLKRFIHKLYPHCHQEMLQVYEAIGLTPLLNQSLVNVKPEDSQEALQVLNKTLQAILLRPKNIDRLNLRDENYLALVKNRLVEAYHKAGLGPTPAIDVERLRGTLLQEALWTEALPKPLPEMDAVLILGSTYQNYLNRQNYFLKLMSSNKIPVRLGEGGAFPVYLLGGDRTLDKKLDAAMIPILKEQNIPLNEQNMMDRMFDQALGNYAGKIRLKRYSTHSPKEAGGRPTTAGTLDSVMQMLKNEKSVLVISSAPFIRYQKLVVERQFLKQGREMQVVAMGPDLKTEMETHSELAKEAFVAITLDNLAREVYEMMLIAKLKSGLEERALGSSSNPKRLLSPTG